MKTSKNNFNTSPNYGENGIWRYDDITSYPSDKLSRDIDNFNSKIHDSLTFINKLPVHIKVIQEPIGENINVQDRIIDRGILYAKNTLKVPYNEIIDGDLFHFIDPHSGKFICRSYSVTKRHGTVLVGNVAAYSETYKRDISAGGDLSSVNIHNLLPWPIIITVGPTGGSVGTPDIVSPLRESSSILKIQANVDLNNPKYHGDITVSPSVYFDNLNQGINIGTQFEVYISIPSSNGEGLTQHLYTFTINDNNEDRIFIGIVSPIIDQSELTGISGDYMLAPRNTTGRAIYRLGKKERDMSKPDFFPGELNYAFNAKNASRTDNLRTTFDSNIRSTVPLARYKKLSGVDVISGIYL